MSRYIDIDDAIATIAGQMSYEIEAETGENADCLDLAEELLNDIPTVSVVRCKECKYRERCEQIVVLDIGEDQLEGRKIDYCSYGERSDT